MKVFLVDDSESVRARIRVSLQEFGADIVGEAANQKEAIEGIVCAQPDVAVFDLQLREGTGLNVLKYMKKACPQITAVVLTNYASEEVHSHCLKAGADHFFEKTRQYVEFIALIRQLNERLTA